MLKSTILTMTFGLCSFLNAYLAMADTIVLKDNRSLKADCIWQKDGKIFYERHGVVVSVDRSQVKNIVDEGGPVPENIFFEAESDKNMDESKQNKKEDYDLKGSKSIVENLLVENQNAFPPAHDFEHNGISFKYISPGVYQTENGTIYKTSQVSLKKQNQATMEKKASESKPTALQNNSIPRDEYGRPGNGSYGRPYKYSKSKATDPNPDRQIYKGNWRPPRIVYRD